MIVAGFGFRKAASADSLADALARANGPAPDVIATADDKTRTRAFQTLSARLRLPVRGIAAEAIAVQDTLTETATSRAARGTGSLAEAAALAAAGPGARLLAPRSVSADSMATCALAEGGAQ